MSTYKREPRWSVELRRIYAEQQDDTLALNAEFILIPKVGFWATIRMWFTNNTGQ